MRHHRDPSLTAPRHARLFELLAQEAGQERRAHSWAQQGDITPRDAQRILDAAQASLGAASAKASSVKSASGFWDFA